MLHPQETRRRLFRRSKIQKTLLFPFFGFLFLMLKLSQLLGFESGWFRLLFSPRYRDAVKKMGKAFEGYTPTEKDVFVCSYMKSGTNWGMQIAYQIACKGQGEYEHIHDVVPWPDAPAEGFAAPLDHPLPTQNPTGMRVIKTHNIAKFVPYNDKAKYFCIVRDPKDVFVSSYHFFRPAMLGFLMPSVKAWFNFMLSADAAEVNWAAFTAGYWEMRHRPNVLFLTFEEMKKDLPAAIRQCADLMGVSLSPAEFERVCELSSYKYMKTINHKFFPGRMLPLSYPEGEMIRSGSSGESDTLLDAEQQALLDKYSAESLQKLGSDFPFEQFYGNKK